MNYKSNFIKNTVDVITAVISMAATHSNNNSSSKKTKQQQQFPR